MNGTLLSVEVKGIRSMKDGSVSITLETQELSPNKAGEVFSLRNQLAVAYLSPKEVNQREIDQVDKLDPEFQGKTQSQRLRNTFFILFSQDQEGFKDFDSYYKVKMGSIIEHYKSLINN